MKRLHRILLIAALGCSAVIAGAGWYAVYHIAPYAIILPSRPQSGDPIYSITPGTLGLFGIHLRVDAGSGVVLDTWFMPAEGEPKGTILLLHGIGATKEHMIAGAADFVHAGYHSVIFDLRAHGRSTGRYCTYGFYEQQDVSCVINAVAEHVGVQGPVGVFGSSLGGAVALQAMARDRRIVCGVVESTFASLDEIVYEYQKHMLAIPFHFVANEALTQACLLARFDASAVQPEQSAVEIACPVLLAHGEADERIHISHGRRIFRALASPYKEWVSVPGAGHNTLAAYGGQEYRMHKLSFFNKWLKQPEQP